MGRHIPGRPSRRTRWCDPNGPWLRAVQLVSDATLAAVVYTHTGVSWILVPVFLAVAAHTALLVLDIRACRRSGTLARGL
jgi:hypothetical protein